MHRLHSKRLPGKSPRPRRRRVLPDLLGRVSQGGACGPPALLAPVPLPLPRAAAKQKVAVRAHLFQLSELPFVQAAADQRCGARVGQKPRRGV